MKVVLIGGLHPQAKFHNVVGPWPLPAISYDLFIYGTNWFIPTALLPWTQDSSFVYRLKENTYFVLLICLRNKWQQLTINITYYLFINNM